MLYSFRGVPCGVNTAIIRTPGIRPPEQNTRLTASLRRMSAMRPSTKGEALPRQEGTASAAGIFDGAVHKKPGKKESIPVLTPPGLCTVMSAKTNLYGCLLLHLVLLDIKHSDEKKGHLALTKRKQAPVLAFAEALEKAAVPMVIRHVLVPDYGYRREWRRLGYLIGRFKSNLKGWNCCLPYNGNNKIQGARNRLSAAGRSEMDKEKAKKARAIILEGIKARRREELQKKNRLRIK